MKIKLFFIVLLSICCLSFTSDRNTKSSGLCIEYVIEVPKVNKADLFNRFQVWEMIDNNYHSQKSIPGIDDQKIWYFQKRSFEFVAPKWWGGGTASTNGYVEYRLKVEFKDGRYKSTFYDFIHYADNGKSFGLITSGEDPPFKRHNGSKARSSLIWNDLKKKACDHAKSIANSLEQGMKEELAISDW